VPTFPIIAIGRQMSVHTGGEHLGQHAGRRAGAHDPAPETGVNVARGVGEHIAPERLIDLRQRRALERNGLIQTRPDLGRNGAPRWSFADRLLVVEHIDDHLSSEGADRRPVCRIEAHRKTSKSAFRRVGIRFRMNARKNKTTSRAERQQLQGRRCFGAGRPSAPAAKASS
jgi:hypothetical protein